MATPINRAAALPADVAEAIRGHNLSRKLSKDAILRVLKAAARDPWVLSRTAPTDPHGEKSGRRARPFFVRRETFLTRPFATLRSSLRCSRGTLSRRRARLPRLSPRWTPRVAQAWCVRAILRRTSVPRVVLRLALGDEACTGDQLPRTRERQRDGRGLWS